MKHFRSVTLCITLVGFVGVTVWLTLLYRAYGSQTLRFLVRSSPEIIWTYSKALLPVSSNVPQSAGVLSTEALERPQASLPPIAAKHVIATMNHTYQKLNNCGPSTASMAASTHGIIFDQFLAADQLKSGPDDKNVGPQELAKFLQSQGLKAVYRINGNPEIIEQLVARDIPVIVEQWLMKRGSGELVGHYRVVRGYDQTGKLFTTNDSFNGPNFVIPYAQFDEWWRPFNRTYVVVYKSEQETMVQAILREDWDMASNIQRAVAVAESESAIVSDGYSFFNLGSALTMMGEYARASTAYDQALAYAYPKHFLWYQFGPLEAYYQTGQYERVREMASQLLKQTGESTEARHYLDLVVSQEVSE